MNDDDFGERSRKVLEQAVPTLNLLVALAQRVEQRFTVCAS